jgi:ADP-heptose:LPS heptosyltransferase
MGHRSLKALEAAWKRLVLKGAGAMLPRPVRGTTPDWGARAHRVLYLRHDRIGDMIMATSLIRAVASSHPGIELDVLASPGNAAVLRGNPHVRRVLLFDRRDKTSFAATFRELRRAGYDAVIDGMVLTPSVTTMMLMLATRARWRVGIGGRGNDFVYTLPVAPPPPDAHHIEWSARTALPFGVDIGSVDWRPELFITGAERGWAEGTWGARDGGRSPERVLVNISATTAPRQWPGERYATVLRHLRQRLPHARIVVTSAPHEESRAATIAAEADAEPVRADLRQAFALIAGADLVFTPDTSIAHAASAFDVPAIVMIVVGMEPFMPWRNRGREVWARAALVNLDAAAVTSIVDEVLAQR